MSRSPPPGPPPTASPPRRPALCWSRGAAERVCRRWRQLALDLPATLSLYFCELHDDDSEDESAGGTADLAATLAALHTLLPVLGRRAIHRIVVLGCTVAMPPQAPALLARALFPQLRRRALTHAAASRLLACPHRRRRAECRAWRLPACFKPHPCRLTLSGSSLLHFSSLLSHCRRLEELDLRIPGLESSGAELLGSHLRCRHRRRQLVLTPPALRRVCLASWHP